MELVFFTPPQLPVEDHACMAKTLMRQYCHALSCARLFKALTCQGFSTVKNCIHLEYCGNSVPNILAWSGTARLLCHRIGMTAKSVAG